MTPPPRLRATILLRMAMFVVTALSVGVAAKALGQPDGVVPWLAFGGGIGGLLAVDAVFFAMARAQTRAGDDKLPPRL